MRFGRARAKFAASRIDFGAGTDFLLPSLRLFSVSGLSPQLACRTRGTEPSRHTYQERLSGGLFSPKRPFCDADGLGAVKAILSA
jgi:hypothetical protein